VAFHPLRTPSITKSLLLKKELFFESGPLVETRAYLIILVGTNFQTKVHYWSIGITSLLPSWQKGPAPVLFVGGDASITCGREVRTEESWGTRKKCLTPQGPNCVFWQHSNFGQVPMNGVFIFFSLKFSHNIFPRSSFKAQQFS